MKQINLDDYFDKKDSVEIRICDTPEEIAETRRANKEMRKVTREYRYRAAISRRLAREFYITR